MVKNQHTNCGALSQIRQDKAPGLSQIEAAKQDGRWDRAYSPQRTAVVPTDFTYEIDKHEKANAFFGTLNKSDIYIIIFIIETAQNLYQRRNRICSIIKRWRNKRNP